jgi:MoxR-like ATPase
VLELPQAEVDEFAAFLPTQEYATGERDYKVALHDVLSRLLSPSTLESTEFPELLAAFFDGTLDVTRLGLSEEDHARIEVAVAPFYSLQNAFANLCGGRFGVNNFVWIPGAIRDGFSEPIRDAFATLVDTERRLAERVDQFRTALYAVEQEAEGRPSWHQNWRLVKPSLPFVAALLGALDSGELTFYHQGRLQPSFEEFVGTWPKSRGGARYEQVVQFVQDVREALNRQGAPVKDMIDAQSFLWMRGEPAQEQSTQQTRGWLFQANPSYYNLDRALRELRAIEWTVKGKANVVHAGDRAYLWRSGPQAGIVAVGTVGTEPAESPPDPAELTYWLQPEKYGLDQVIPRVRVDIDQVLGAPLLRTTLREDSVLSGLMVIRAPQGTIYEVSPEQQDRIDELMSGSEPRSIRYFVLQQRSDRAYEWDQEGSLYHFTPNASGAWRKLSESPGARFVYYRPGAGADGRTFFGAGRVDQIEVEGEGAERHFRAHLLDFERFARPVPRTEFDPRPNVQMSISEISRDQFERLLSLARRVETEPFTVDSIKRAATEEPRRLELDEEIYASIFSALQSGKHVVLTGPPGTAKTTLAEAVAEAASRADLCSGHVLTTATADWTTYETIGGLRPTEDGGLSFAPGHFLEAIKRNQWLVIDELNRSNFDRAFGQLFTVLSGQAVQLPYELDGASGRLALVPEGAATPSGADPLAIPSSWRVIATMNVFDKSLLFEMSFALMRRFAFIEVPAPPDPVFEGLILRAAGDDPDVAELTMRLYELRRFKDLGPALYMDIAKFLAVRRAQEPADEGQLVFEAFYSYLLPQFEGIDQAAGERLWKTLKLLVGSSRSDRLRRTLNAVLGLDISVPSASDQDEEEEPLIPDEAQLQEE